MEGAVGSCGGCGEFEVNQRGCGSAVLSGVAGGRAWWAEGDGFGGSAALGFDFSHSCGSGVSGCHV